MQYIKLLFFSLLMTSYSGSLYSQYLTNHKWENRLVLVLVDDTNNNNYQKQIKKFKDHSERMQERKLLVYHITPETFKLGLKVEKWQKSKTDYALYKERDGQPEIILIGLDGGIKLRATEFLSTRKLFATNDAMPMRMQEMRKKKNQ